MQYEPKGLKDDEVDEDWPGAVAEVNARYHELIAELARREDDMLNPDVADAPVLKHCESCGTIAPQPKGSCLQCTAYNIASIAPEGSEEQMCVAPRSVDTAPPGSAATPSLAGHQLVAQHHHQARRGELRFTLLYSSVLTS